MKTVRHKKEVCLYLGDCLEALRSLKSNSVDSIVTDPPYGLKFMGKKWDYEIPKVEVWRECLRVLKPGGHMLVACGTRTQHRMVVNIEDAGFEVRDVITWLYGSGFPKSLDVSKAIDKAAGAEREVIGEQDVGPDMRGGNFENAEGRMIAKITAPATDLAKQWQGWGTALKPACEFWTLARKPLEGTVAANVLKHGVGGINVDGCRIESPDANLAAKQKNFDGMGYGGNSDTSEVPTYNPIGRFPANLILDEEAAAMLGEPSRFFYVAKASKSERNAGCEGLGAKEKQGARPNSKDMSGKFPDHDHRPSGGNNHPTVKPVKLMRYLCRLITPPGGLVLDPFMGSGSTGVAALQEMFRFYGVELNGEYFEIAKVRLRDLIKKSNHAYGGAKR